MSLIERPFWQTDWHGIPFTSLGVALSLNTLASSAFYTAFYDALFAKYLKFSDLDVGWRLIKNATSRELASILPLNARTLSYGCGIGYVEFVLNQLRPDLCLSALDFSERWTHFLELEEHSIKLIGPSLGTTVCELGVEKYDVIYLSQVLYAVPFQDSVDLLSVLREHLSENGKIVLAHVNGTVTVQTVQYKMLAVIKNVLRPAYRRFFVRKNSNKQQFWGWERPNASYIDMLVKAGFKVDSITSTSAASQSFITACVTN